MKYITQILTILVLVFCSSLYGQSRLDKVKRIPAEDMATKRTALLNETLAFSETQKAEVYQVNLKAAKQRKAVFENASMFTMRKQLKPIKIEVDKALSTILTSEQWQMYNDEDYQEKLKTKMKTWINSL